MGDDELFDEFYDKLNNILSLFFNLGKKMTHSKVIHTILRLLSKRSQPNIATIEESINIDELKLDEMLVIFRPIKLITIKVRKLMVWLLHQSRYVFLKLI